MMREAMKMRYLRLPTLAAFVFILFTACSTDPIVDPAIADGELPLLQRPRFEKPVPRPLGRILLAWSVIDGATGYILQMSSDNLFETIEKSWTIRGQNLELPLGSEADTWFRIRAFNESDNSRWSAILHIREDL